MQQNNARLYPLLDVASSSHDLKTGEQASLLAQDFFEKDGQALMPVAPTPYGQLFISKDESEETLGKLRKTLEEKKRSLKNLPKDLDGTLRILKADRTFENIKSNATVSGITSGAFCIGMILQAGGDPRIAENGGWNKSAIGVTYNIIGWIASMGYSMSQCFCRSNTYEVT